MSMSMKHEHERPLPLGQRPLGETGENPELFIQQLAAHIVAATSAVVSASVASKSATEE